MPYRRPSEPPSHEELMRLFEKAIKGLVQRFLDHAYAFYTENDLHCYLYHRLYAGGKVNGLYRTADGYETILLHKEYPTCVRYRRGTGGILEESDQGPRRGAFDISIWDPQVVSEHEHRRQKVLCAAELALNECGSGNPHTINDTAKLASTNNGVKYGYLLFFIRNSKDYKRNEEKIRKNLEEAAKKVRVAFTCVDESYKPRSEFPGPWGMV